MSKPIEVNYLKCFGNKEHSFTNEYSEYCDNGCGEKESVFTIKKLNKENEELKKENKILSEALEFYAVSETYVLFKIDDTSQVVDRGTIAREALEKIMNHGGENDK